MKLRKKQSYSQPNGKGSALVVVVVLTVLLATIGTLFVMASRLSLASTESIADNKDLQSGIETVLAKIKTVLTDDLFGNDGKMVNNDGGSDEPYDHPGPSDPWLASIEPVKYSADPCEYRWQRISDIYGYLTELGINGWIDGNGTVASPDNLIAHIISPDDIIDYTFDPSAPTNVVNYGCPADADGDGVADSRWIRLPGMTGSKGQPVFAAVRIIDNCAMLNVNTAHTNDIKEPSEGKYLSSVDYERFLRGRDRGFPDRIRLARDPCEHDAEFYHKNVIMNIENPGPEYSPFDIGDELEIRNRCLLTSQVIARFEREDFVATSEDEAVAYDTFDFGRGEFVGGGYSELRVKRIPFDDDDFKEWKWQRRMDPCNFDRDSGGDPCDAYMYDRRHVCTFYSFVRNIRRPYPSEAILRQAGDVFIPYRGVADIRGINSNTLESRKKILHLLYAFRAYFLNRYPTEDYKQAARRSAQVVANMIDFVDDINPTTEGPFFDPPYSQSNENPTFINRRLIRFLISEVSGGTIDIGDPAPATLSPYEFGLGVDDPDETVYGYERQPFISEIYRDYDNVTGTEKFAIELCNHYNQPIDLRDLAYPEKNWRIEIGEAPGSSVYLFPPASTVPEAGSGTDPGRAVFRSDSSVPATGTDTYEISGLSLSSVDNVVKLQRPDPANTGQFITVDKTLPSQIPFGAGQHSSKRDDTKWRFADMGNYINDATPTLGSANNVSPAGARGFQMPVANNDQDLATVLDLERVLFIGNEKGGTDPNTITAKIAAASGNESEIRFDIDENPELLGYVSLLNRDEGTLPGRININTATMEVIRAAIPPVASWSPDCNDLAIEIINHREISGAYNDPNDLLGVPGFNQFADPCEQVGDSEMGEDFEEKHWILSRVGNIFTVRSDVFTAYILVRLGIDGPQKRMMAILDRTGVYLPSDKPKIVALHPVPDPR